MIERNRSVHRKEPRHPAWNRQAQIDIAHAITRLSGLHIIVFSRAFTQPNHLLWTLNRTASLRKTVDSFSGLGFFFFNSGTECYVVLSHDVASESEITPCIKIDKPLVVYRFQCKRYENDAFNVTHIANPNVFMPKI